MRATVAAICVTCVALTPLIGCDRNTATPTSPVVEQAIAPAPVAPKVAIAQLELFDASVVAVPGGYSVAFLLKETSGQSGAVIKSVQIANDAGRVDVTDGSCWGWSTVIRVPPGGTLDAFDSRFASPLLTPGPYDYCGAYSIGATSQVRVTVVFADDGGTIGTVTASIPTR